MTSMCTANSSAFSSPASPSRGADAIENRLMTKSLPISIYLCDTEELTAADSTLTADRRGPKDGVHFSSYAGFN